MTEAPPHDDHVHQWGDWTPRNGPNAPWARGCLTCPETTDTPLPNPAGYVCRHGYTPTVTRPGYQCPGNTDEPVYPGQTVHTVIESTTTVTPSGAHHVTHKTTITVEGDPYGTQNT